MISGGGTGGHVYPALAVAERLPPSDAICYVGSVGGVEEELVGRAGLSFRAISAGGLRGLAPWRVILNLVRLARGTVQASRIVGDFDPDVVFVTGGYVCVPVVLSAWRQRRPILIYLPDIVPGLAIRFLARFAARVAVSFSPSQAFFNRSKVGHRGRREKKGFPSVFSVAEEKVVVSGYPVRSAFFTADRQAAREALGLERDRKTVTVFGGSRGAHSLNLALEAILERLLEDCQVIHLCGLPDAERVEKRGQALSEAVRRRYKAYPYLHQDEEMVNALAAADLVVARAGASTLGELPALGLPGILVPYPYAGRHQADNADYLARHGAALVIEDADLGEKLLPTIIHLLEDDQKRSEMSRLARALAQPQAAERIAALLRELAKN